MTRRRRRLRSVSRNGGRVSDERARTAQSRVVFTPKLGPALPRRRSSVHFHPACELGQDVSAVVGCDLSRLQFERQRRREFRDRPIAQSRRRLCAEPSLDTRGFALPRQGGDQQRSVQESVNSAPCAASRGRNVPPTLSALADGPSALSAPQNRSVFAALGLS